MILIGRSELKVYSITFLGNIVYVIFDDLLVSSIYKNQMKINIIKKSRIDELKIFLNKTYIRKLHRKF